MHIQPDTYQLLLCIVTLGVTLTAGFLLGILAGDRRAEKSRPHKVGHRS